MRTKTIDFTLDPPFFSGEPVGEMGEHNATDITVIPPEEMSACEQITSYAVVFAVGGKLIRSRLFGKNEEITIPLAAQLTQSHTFCLQLEGYADDGSLIFKSPLVSDIRLSFSAQGDEEELSGKNNSIAADIAANTAARHSHENIAALDKLGESSGKLTFNGNPVGERQTVTAELDVSEFYTDNLNEFNTAFLINNTLKIPEGAEITAVEINTASIENPVWTDLRDMIYEDPFSPYYVNLCKMKYCEKYGGYLICVLSFLSSFVNSFQTDIVYGQLCGMKVTYTVGEELS